MSALWASERFISSDHSLPAKNQSAGSPQQSRSAMAAAPAARCPIPASRQHLRSRAGRHFPLPQCPSRGLTGDVASIHREGGATLLKRISRQRTTAKTVRVSFWNASYSIPAANCFARSIWCAMSRSTASVSEGIDGVSRSGLYVRLQAVAVTTSTGPSNNAARSLLSPA
jgi:hypothetical protein